MNVLFIEVTTVCKDLMWLRSQNVLKGTMQQTFAKKKVYRKYK